MEGELEACQQNRPVSEQPVAQLHRGKTEVEDQQTEKHSEVDWKKNNYKKKNHCTVEGDHHKEKKELKRAIRHLLAVVICKLN